VSVREHLVVIVPGIGGSVLARPENVDKVVWDAGFGDIAGLGFHPGELSFAEQPELTPVGLIKGRRLLPGWTVVHGYGGLLTRLGRLPGAVVDEGHPGQRVRGANVVAFPYDFRRSIVAAAQRLAAEVTGRLDELGVAERDRGKRVVVVAHSMGGLVARYWLGRLGGWPVCRSLITLGTPHRGAPKALDLLVNGVRMPGWPRVLRGPTMLLREWESPYELLPRYRCVWDAGVGAARYPYELPSPWLAGRAGAAFAVHQEMARAWEQTVPRSGPEMVVRLGYSHQTASSAWWEGGQLRVSRECPSWLELSGWQDDHGDGTVPAISAVPTELDGVDVRGLRVLARHGPIASLAEVVELLESYEGRASLLPARGRGAERPASIGLDLAEMYLAGEPIPLAAQLHGLESDVPEHAVWATLRAVGATLPLAEVRMEWDPGTGAFRTDLPGVGAGLYEITVVARAVPGAGDLSVSDTVGVLDGADLD
jgi:pimeloyl-ACP methyl ester carboxylesterase